MGTRRAELREIPQDGVLVLDVGGTGMKEADLKGFLLRRLRVNPGRWLAVGVWDEKGDVEMRNIMSEAPAGVVMIAEGWALSPPRMRALHQQLRELAGLDVLVHFLVVNLGSDGLPKEIEPTEKQVWQDFVDDLADASAEIYFYEDEAK